MKSLYESIIENTISGDKGSDDIIKTYLTNINRLPFDKQQHFMTRLNLFMKVNVSEYMNQLSKDIYDIKKMFDSNQYKKIVDTYVINPYITTNSEKLNSVGEWLKSIKDKSLLKLLSIGVYLDKKSILSRHNYECVDISIDVDEIYEQLFSHSDLLSHNATLYINCAGYMWNLYHKNAKNWKKIRNIIMDGERTTKNVYGITHILLQASNFYTKSIDSIEYSDELEEINKLLMNYRTNHYKEISLDLLCEMVVCLHYSDRTYSEYAIAKRYIESKLKQGSIMYNTKSTGNILDDLTNNEHTNILYVLLQKTDKKQ